jgi:serine/threonine protein kinase
MQIDTSAELLFALRGSNLFDSEQLASMSRELQALGDDPPALMRHILEREWMSLYQLRKVLHGKTSELYLGAYLLIEKVGEGGMGKVYRARRLSDNRPIALKIIRPILLANPVIRKRYDREVASALTLKHPNIVEVFDAGEIDGRFYLAMEFVDGIDLARLVKEHRPLEVAEACEYVRQAALGLHYAHQAGFVHRDIKPSNIVVSGERHIAGATEPAVAKILDMGLIRSGGLDLTRSGTVVGTPDYMAPEQSKNSSTVDHRADLYSLGCTLYYLLASQPPFPDGNPLEKIIKHQLEAPLPLQALRRDVPATVAEIVAKLMAKSPDQRYPTALAAAEALEAIARRTPLAPGRPRDSNPYPSDGSDTSPTVSQIDSVTPSTPIGGTIAPPDRAPKSPSRTKLTRAPVVETYPLEGLNEPTTATRPVIVTPPPPAKVKPAESSATSWKYQWWVIAIASVVLLALCLGFWLIVANSKGKTRKAILERAPASPSAIAPAARLDHFPVV